MYFLLAKTMNSLKSFNYGLTKMVRTEKNQKNVKRWMEIGLNTRLIDSSATQRLCGYHSRDFYRGGAEAQSTARG
jgi:hypothetical protein